jgi:hypothetical protein
MHTRVLDKALHNRKYLPVFSESQFLVGETSNVQDFVHVHKIEKIMYLIVSNAKDFEF